MIPNSFGVLGPVRWSSFPKTHQDTLLVAIYLSYYIYIIIYTCIITSASLLVAKGIATSNKKQLVAMHLLLVVMPCTHSVQHEATHHVHLHACPIRPDAARVQGFPASDPVEGQSFPSNWQRVVMAHGPVANVVANMAGWYWSGISSYVHFGSVL